jgi:hypothetical protein
MGSSKYFFLACLAVVSFFVAIASTFAGTYNFYFDNAEQGDNSTATPTVKVNGNEKSDADVTQHPAASSNAPAASPVAVAPHLVSDEETPRSGVNWNLADLFNQNRFHHFSFGVGYANFDYSSKAPYDSNTYMGGDSGEGPLFSVGYDLNRDIGLKIYMAQLDNYWIDGANLELTPIHISIGKVDDLIDLGGLVGAEEFHDGWPGEKFVFGPRMNVNLTPAIQITSACRFTTASRLIEAGMALRL